MYKKLILEGQEKFKRSHPLKRDIFFPFEILEINKIIIFIGPRRAGKTYFMLYTLQELIQLGKITVEQIVLIDFSELFDKEFDIHILLQNYFELFPDLEPFFVFDEIQELDNFRENVLYLFNKNYKLFLSGSNSKLLSSELSTHFGGRTYEIKIFPLSWIEFCNFRNITLKSAYTNKEYGILKNKFIEYLSYGAFPEIILINDINIKYDLIKSYFDVLVYRDLLLRYGLENEYVIKYLIKKIILSNTKDFSVTKIFNDLKSQSINIGVQTIYNYLEYLKQIFLISEIFNLYKKTGKKFYLNDIGFTNLIEKNNIGQRFENLIYLHILRKYGKINYISGDYEIDFILDEENTAIQVCYDLNFQNETRELITLEKSNFKNKLIIYYQNEINSNKYPNINFIDILDFFNFK